MKILITGADGFIGRNLCSVLQLREDIELLNFTRQNSPAELSSLVLEADFIYHLAGVNRPSDESDFDKVNAGLTEVIVSTLRKAHKNTPLLITSSTQAELDNPYGKSKLAAEKLVLQWHNESSSPVFVYRLPGVFGKWCRPNYNSVVATFCYNIANNKPIEISNPDHMLTLAYIDDVVSDFESQLGKIPGNQPNICEVSRTFTLSLKDLADRIKVIHDIRSKLVVPSLSDILNKFLYATYISYLSSDSFSYRLSTNTDERGSLAEFIKSDSFGQIFVSKTKPGKVRGDHWHKTKIEKFFVVSGQAEIIFRNKTDQQDIIRYQVDGADMEVVDIPTGYVHAIKNIGDTDLITIFWANELFDKDRPDTYYEKVEV